MSKNYRLFVKREFVIELPAPTLTKAIDFAQSKLTDLGDYEIRAYEVDPSTNVSTGKTATHQFIVAQAPETDSWALCAARVRQLNESALTALQAEQTNLRAHLSAADPSTQAYDRIAHRLERVEMQIAATTVQQMILFLATRSKEPEESKE